MELLYNNLKLDLISSYIELSSHFGQNTVSFQLVTAFVLNAIIKNAQRIHQSQNKDETRGNKNNCIILRSFNYYIRKEVVYISVHAPECMGYFCIYICQWPYACMHMKILPSKF